MYQILQEYILLEDQSPAYLDQVLTYGVEGWRNLNKINLEDQDEGSSVIMELKNEIAKMVLISFIKF